VVLVKKEVLGFSHFHASLLDGVHQILGREQGLAFRLVSATAADPGEPPTPSSPSSLLLANARSVARRRPCRNETPRRALPVATAPPARCRGFFPSPPWPRGPRTRPTYQVVGSNLDEICRNLSLPWRQTGKWVQASMSRGVVEDWQGVRRGA
jgi:hypothetical protein